MFLKKYTCFNPEPKQNRESMPVETPNTSWSKRESVNRTNIFNNPGTDAKPEIITIWKKFGSFLKRYFRSRKTKLTPIKATANEDPIEVNKAVVVVSELKIASNSDTAVQISINNYWGISDAIIDSCVWI